MTFKKSICLVGSILATFNAFAVENSTESSNSKINLDILGGIGYTNYDQIKDDNSNNNISTSANGFNVSASALYSIIETKIGSPVVGLGLNYARVVSKEKRIFSNGLLNGNSKFTMSTLALVANAGFKFTPAPKFAIFTLANFGYGVYNSMKLDNTISVAGTAINFTASGDGKLSNHFLYGASVIGMYEVAQNFSVGLGLTYNRHSFKLDSVTMNNTTTDIRSKVSLNEYSANLIASYSL